MKLYFKQRLFSWFDSYDIYGEDGQVCYTVEGKLSWGAQAAHFESRRGAYCHSEGGCADAPAVL